MTTRPGRLPRGASILLLSLVALLTAAMRASPEAGDVILVVVDTLRAQNLSHYGYERDTSRHLARFGEDAVTYENAITPGTWTVPAHGSLFTGRLPSFHGAERVAGEKIQATPLRPEVATLAEILRERGRPAAGFVANETYVTPLLGFDRGFEPFVAKDRPAGDVLDTALEWLEREPAPSFLFVNLLDPHEPYDPPEPYRERFPGGDATLGTSLTELVRRDGGVTREAARHFVSLYDGEVAYADRSLGRFFDRLRELGRYDDALIVVTSDHGEMLGEHGAAGHGGLPYEELVRVPLLVKYPRSRDAGRRVPRRVSTLGVFPTILAELGIDPPSNIEGVPLDEPHRVWVEDVNFVGERVTVGYDGDRKIVYVTQNPYGALPSATLFDLGRDPGEDEPAGGFAEVGRDEALVDLATRPRPANPLSAPPVEPARRRKLRALGYVE